MDSTSKPSKKMAIISAMFLFFGTGGISAYVVPYGYLPDFLGTTMIKISFAVSILSVAGALLSLVVGPLIRKIGIRGCMLTAAVAFVLFGGLIAFLPGLVSLYVAFFCGGVLMAVGGYACSGQLMANWYKDKCATWISFGIGASMIGAGLFTALGGVMFAHFGVAGVFIQCAVCGLINIPLALMVKDRPDGEVEETVKEKVEKTEEEKALLRKVYKDPVTWLFFIASFFVRFMIMPIALYTTVYFPEFGMSIEASAFIVTLCGFAAGAFNLIGGKILEKIKITKYITIVLLGIVGIYVFTQLYATMPYLWVVGLMIVCYAFGATSLNMSAIISPMLFDKSVCGDITGKAVGVAYGGNMVCPVFVAWVLGKAGYIGCWSIAVVAAVFSFIIYMAIIVIRKRQNLL